MPTKSYKLDTKGELAGLMKADFEAKLKKPVNIFMIRINTKEQAIEVGYEVVK